METLTLTLYLTFSNLIEAMQSLLGHISSSGQRMIQVRTALSLCLPLFLCLFFPLFLSLSADKKISYLDVCLKRFDGAEHEARQIILMEEF